MFASDPFASSGFAETKSAQLAPLPAVQVQPIDVSVDEGQTATFTATFSDAETIQWYRNSQQVIGANNSALNFSAQAINNGDTFYAVATNASGSVQTNTVTLTVIEVSTNSMIVDFNIASSMIVDFSINAAGPSADVIPDAIDLGQDVTGAALGQVVQRQFTILGIDAGEAISLTATGSASLSAVSAQLGDVITVTLTASNTNEQSVTGGVDANGVTDSFTVTTLAAGAADRTPDAITLNDVTGAEPGSTQAFNVTIQGIDSGETIPVSATGSGSVSANSGQLGDVIVLSIVAGSFNQVVTGGIDLNGVSASVSVTTRNAVGPTVTSQPVARTVTENASTSISAVVSNATSYQWYRNGVIIAGANASSYSPATALSNNGDLFYLVATGENGLTVQTNTVALTVLESNTFIDAPEIVQVTRGRSVVHLHDGESIPITDPKDPRSDIWRQFTLSSLLEGETLIDTPVVLINDQEVELNQSIEGLELKAIETDGQRRVKVRIAGGNEGSTYTLTIRYEATYTPQDFRSERFEVKKL